MENKIKISLSSINDVDTISKIVVSGLSNEFVIDEVRKIIRKYQDQDNLKSFIDKFASIIDNAYDVSFVNFENWHATRSDTLVELLKLTAEIDQDLTSHGIIESRQVVEDLQEKLTQFLMSLASIDITENYIDFKNVKIDPEYITSAVEQLNLLDEGMLMSVLTNMELGYVPLDVKQDKNMFIEEKLKKLSKIISASNSSFENDYSKLLTQVLNMYDKFYSISFGSYTDGERVEKARQVLKTLTPHRMLLDKLEDKLSEANELKRQLSIHSTKLDKSLIEARQNTEQKIERNREESDVFNAELNAKEYMTGVYNDRIENAINDLTDLQNKISNHYKVLDQLEISLKNAIPSEDALTKFSSIGFKFQELCVKLELNKSQPTKPDKELIETIKTAELGMQTCVKLAKEFKDIYLRNSLLTAIFKAVNDLNDFAVSTNKATQLNQINFVTEKLNSYSKQENAFNENILAYKKIANDTIRNVSIVMGKPFKSANMLEIIDMLDVTIKQLKLIKEKLDVNHDEQLTIMRSIMTM